MNKPSWKVVLQLHEEYMRKLVVSMYNQYHAYTRVSGEVVEDEYSNKSGSRYNINLFDKGDLLLLSAKAFKKAYKEWDGIRQFGPFYRIIFINSVRYLVREELQRRYREVQILDIQDESGKNTIVDMAPDTKSYLIPSEMADFNDFIHTLPEASKVLVEAVLNAPIILGVSFDASIKQICSQLHKYTLSLGWSNRFYWETFSRTKVILKERLYGKDSLRNMYRTNSRIGTHV